MSTTQLSARDRILQAHAKLIARDGYANSKIVEIAREARVSLRTFYEEFGSKERCFLVLHEVLVEQVAGMLEETANFDRPWREAMHQSFETYFRLLLASPRVTAAVMLELTTLSDDGAEAREYARERFSTLLVRLVDRGRAAYPDVPSRPLTPLLARGILGAVIELVTGTVVDESGDTAAELAETATELLWSVVTNTESVAG